MNKTTNTLYHVLQDKFGSDTKIAKQFNVKRPSVFHWRREVPEKVALLCHLSPNIPYTYNPADYGRNSDNLDLVLSKPSK
ncbi:hypothetical protein [Budvicia aquatica]|uniref:hypothetical protein n=1 Tax=Budvicia aquatica TaxID=82979 RepID=UPI002083F442|nr:hypothetical protein [Budvicia aquatica]GKX50580.1 hypothetical protein SOASR029_08890 [Budvicia aquatica]